MSDDLDLDDLDLDLEDEEPEPQQPSTSPKRLREAYRRAKERAGKADEFEQRANSLERELAVTRAGLGDLDAKKLDALLKVHTGALAPDALKQTAADLGFITVETPAEDTAAEQTAQAHAAASQAAVGAGTAASGVLNAGVVGPWSHEKKARFSRDHKDLWEQLKRGEQVTAPPGW